jgi:hypothetical protein
MTYAPFASVTASRVTCVAWFFTETVAPGRTALELSTTVPAICPVNP